MTLLPPLLSGVACHASHLVNRMLGEISLLFIFLVIHQLVAPYYSMLFIHDVGSIDLILQSSCVINVTRANSNNSNTTATATTSLASARHHSNRIISTDLNSSSSTKEPPTYKTRNGIQNQQRVALNEQANVIYVKSCHAKAVKNE